MLMIILDYDSLSSIKVIEMCHSVDFFILRFGATIMVLIFFVVGRRI
jgi:hypothetical protein